MKKKALLLTALGVFALGACVQTQPATNENIADLKAALKKEEAKSDLGYHLSGNMSYATKIGATTAASFELKNLEGDLSFVGYPTAENPSVRGEDLKAYASFKYTEFNLNVLDPDTLDEVMAISTTNAERHSAAIYVANGDAYIDLSNIGIDTLRVEGENENVESGKIRLPGIYEDTHFVVNEGGSILGSLSALMGMSESEMDTYVLKNVFEFKKSGDATEAVASMDAAKLRNVYVSKELAVYYAQVLPTIPEENQNDALVAERNALEQAFNEAIPAFNLNLSIKYNTKGLTAITLSTQGKIVSYLEDLVTPVSVEFDIDLAVKVQNASIPSDFNTSGYTDFDVDLN